jgi:lipoprotein signal peptidase
MSAQARRSYRWLFWSLVVAGFVLDQGTKYGVFAWLHDEAVARPDRSATRDLIPGAFHIWTPFDGPDDGGGLLGGLRTWGGAYLPHVNRGALWGVGNGGVGNSWNSLFLVVSVAAAVAILVWSARRGWCRDPLLCVALGLILAGTLGNLYDRVVFDGVRDFLHWNKWFDWPVFNLADSCLVCGASLLLWQALGSPAAAKQPAAVFGRTEAESTAAR